MPLRSLIYFVNIIRKLVQNKNVFGKTLIRIPVPHFVVFYNGNEAAPERYELKLSDAFEKKTEQPEIELVCQVYNINKGNNTDMLAKCTTLRDYMYFVDMIREYHEKSNFNNLAEAIERAVNQCIRENVLKDFLTEHRSEVMKMMQLDYTFERQIELEREEAEKQGWRQGEEYGFVQGEKNGIKKKQLDLIRKKLAKGKSLEQIADELEETPDAIRPLYEQIQAELGLAAK